MPRNALEFGSINSSLSPTGNLHRDYIFHKPILFPLQTKEKMKANKQLYALLALRGAL
jgi:hypothetical protein